MKKGSPRAQIRDLAEETLRASREPMHHERIAEVVLGRLGLSATVSAKTVNTTLHDDPAQRFLRVGRGTWTLKELRR